MSGTVPVHFVCTYLCLFTQSCPSLCDPVTVACQAPLTMGVFQAKILEWVAMPSSMRSFQLRLWTQASHIAGGFFIVWATRGSLYIHSRSSVNIFRIVIYMKWSLFCDCPSISMLCPSLIPRELTLASLMLWFSIGLDQPIEAPTN